MKSIIWIFGIWLMLVVAVRLAHCEINLQNFSEFDARIIKFNQVWNSYYRKHFNCPVDATKLAECRPDSNSVDYSGFAHVSHEALNIFGPAEAVK